MDVEGGAADRTGARHIIALKQKLTEEDQARLSNLGNNPPREPSGKQMTGTVHVMRADEQSAYGSANNGSNGSAYSASGMQPSSSNQ